MNSSKSSLEVGMKTFVKICYTSAFTGTEKFVKNIEEVFYVSANFDHNFDFKTNASKSLRTVHAEIVHEIKEKYGNVFKMMDFAGVFASFFFIWMFLKFVFE